MTIKRAALIASSIEDSKPKKLSQVKDKEEKRFMIEDAAFTLERMAKIEREIADIKADPELFAAAKAKIDQKIADLATAKTS